MIRHDGYTMVEPTAAQIIEAVGGSVCSDVERMRCRHRRGGTGRSHRRRLCRIRGPADGRAGREVSGGQAGSSPMIRNYPGFPHGISGHELTRRACEQAWMFGAHMVFSQPAVGLECRGGERIVHLADGHQIAARAVIVATGHRLAPSWRAAPGGAGRLRRLLRRGRERDAGHGGPRRVRRGSRELGRPDRAAPGAARPAGDDAGAGDSLARSMSDYLIREIEATANITVRLHTEVTDGHGARSARRPHPARPAGTAGPSRSRRPRCSC